MRGYEVKSRKRGDLHPQRRALDCWPSPILLRQRLANMDDARMIEADQPPPGRGKAGRSGHDIPQAGDIGDRESTRRAPGDAHCDHQPPEPLDDARILLVASGGVRSTAAPVMSTAEGHGCPPGMFERPLSLRRDAPLIARHCAPSRQTLRTSLSARLVGASPAEGDFGSEPRSTARRPCAASRRRGHLPQGVGLGCDAGYCANAQGNARSRRKALVEPKSIILEKSVLARAAFRANLQGPAGFAAATRPLRRGARSRRRDAGVVMPAAAAMRACPLYMSVGFRRRRQ